MKKFIYLLPVLALFFTACDPMEDINAVLDAQEQIISGDATLTLSDDDYDALNLNYGNFSSIDDAKAMIPGLLNKKFPVWGEGSLATVTFKWYNPMSTPSGYVYALSDAEHNAITGRTYGNFDRSYHIFNYLDATFPSPSEGEFHSLRYRFYAGGETTLTDGFLYENGQWTRFVGFTPDEYNAMGESYPNFSSHDEAAIKIPLALPDIYKFNPKKAGDIVQAMYELYKGGGQTKSYVNNYIFDGTSWSKYNNVALETIKFGHDGTTWVPDNTIKYTLTSADYALVGNDRYGNFDVRAGKDEESVEARLAKINTILLNNFPGMAEGQKFIVFYNVYSGANEVWQMKVILTGGQYVLQ
ncbi:hypothetical protein Lupro_09550 [Lutibacter profundi]|uniref:Uncharacterized protein n=1 Tax=Lutibacter profundi TaxID=1622118 RepID=A0A0X8G7J4_9FLAO|nr:hypothetical protein [Lutibacter profundi]AMC11495.1 hypothetical protein Lupro_09550 [Lutibacter profundi]